MSRTTTSGILSKFRRKRRRSSIDRRGRRRSAKLESLESRLLLSATSFETEKVLVAAGATGDTFGFAVSIDGDTAIVGSRLADPGGIANAGAAAVYTRNAAGNWSFQDDLVGGDVIEGDHFGYSVSIHGNRAVVGALYEDSVGKSGNGAAYVFVDDGTGNWSLEQKLTAADAQDADRLGVSVDIHGDTIIAGAYYENTGVSNNGAAYVFTRSGSTWSQQQKLLANDLDSNDQFGFSVSVHGDTALVGSYGDNVGSNADQGSAYIFNRSGSTWSQQTKLLSSDAAAFDQFGRSVSLDQDIAVIGAHLSDSGGIDGTGGAYVFTRGLTGNWSEQTKLQASDAAESDNFGFAVDVRGDKIIVGAHRHNFAGEDASGSAYLFEQNSVGSWTEVAKFAASDHEPLASLGFSVAVDGAVALAGATGANNGATTDTGAVYSFTLDEDMGDAPAPYPTIRANNGPSHGIVSGFSLGTAIDMDAQGKPSLEAKGDDADGNDDEDGVTFGQLKIGDAATTVDVVVTNAAGVANPYLDAWIDFNADGDWDDAGEQIYSAAVAAGTNTLMFAVPGDAEIGQMFARFRLHDGTTRSLPTGPATSGEVEDYRVNLEFDAANPEQVAKLLASDADGDDGLGYHVSVDGDTAIVTALFEDIGGLNAAGAAYVYTRDLSGTWTEQTKLTASDTAAGDWFGLSVNLNGNTAIIGARNVDSGGNTNNGAAYIFVRDELGNWLEQAKLVASDAADDDLFGKTVAVQEDTAVVGAYLHDSAGLNNSGAAYVFARDADGDWTQQAKLTASDVTAGDAFGGSISLDGDTLIIGAQAADVAGQDNAGAFYSFTRDSSGAWTEQSKHSASDPALAAAFGHAVSHSGDTLVVGAYNATIGGNTQAGASYVFTRDSSGNWTEEQKLLPLDSNVNSYFGYSVDVEGGVVAVGAYIDDASGLTNSGASYIFEENASGVWTQTHKLVSNDASESDSLGVSLDLDGDTLFVGAYGEDTAPNTGNGAAYIFDLATIATDLGDAPAPYPTLLADNGPVHTEVAGFSLGTLWDSETDGLPSLEANGDDSDSTDDENGVTFGQLKIGDSAATVDVVITNTAGVTNPYLDAWIDFNADGYWDDAGEHITSTAVTAGTNTIAFAIPADAAIGQTFARFRLHDGTTALLPTGSADSGEVEDYQVSILEVLPVAVDDNYSTTEDAVLSPTQDLLDNDSDPLSRDLTLTEINGQPLSVSAGSEISTAVLNPAVGSTMSLNADNYYGFRFELTEATTIERVGGNFQFFTGTGPFAAIVALDSETDLPDSEGLSTSDVIATTVIPLAFQDDGEKSAEINAELDAGWYAVVFGTGDFGSTGLTNLYVNNTAQGDFSFIHAQPGVPRFLTPSSNASIRNARLFVTKADGTLVPTDFTLPSGAALNVGPDGQFSYDPRTAFNSLADGTTASDSFEYTLVNSDGGEAAATATIDITGVNDIPTAVSQTVVVSENLLASKPAAIGLLSGAADPDTGDTLSVTQINGAAIVSGQPISLPSGATIVVDSDGSFVYDPTTAFDGLTDGETGSDSLTFTISDGNRGTATETLSITINGFNDFPTISALTDPIVIDEGETAALSGTVGDAEPGELTLSASPGSVTLQPDGETFDWQFTATDDRPTEIVTITITDAGGRSKDLLFELTVNNVAPTLILDASPSANQLEPIALVLNNVEDPGDDTIVSATIDWGDGTSTTVSSLDDVSHVYTVAPGIYQLDVTLEDEDGTYVGVATTQVAITNVAPILQTAEISATAIDEGQTVTLDVSWLDGDESHILDIDWGDGNTSSLYIPPGETSKSLSYTYVDDTPFGTSQDDFDIVVTVSDSEFSSSTIAADSISRSFDGLRQIGSTGSTTIVGIETDGSGNQYVAGSFSGELWQSGELVATTGAANTDWYVTKYGSSGERLWTRTIGRPSFAETLEAMTVSASGDIVLAGGVTSATDLDPGDETVLPNGGDNVIVRLSTSGDFLNATSLSGALSFSDVDIDSAGNVAVTGRFAGFVDFDSGSEQTLLEAAGNWAGFAAVFGASGDLSWARGFIGTNYAAGTSVALHENTVTVGGIFRDSVTIDSLDSGSQITSNGDFDLYVARFDLDGNHQWHAATGGTGADRAYDVAVSRDGSVFVAAAARGLIDIDPTETTVDVNLGSSLRPLLWVLAEDGTLLWHDDVRTSGNSRFTAVDISPNDQRVIAGGTFDSLIFNDDGTNIFQPSLGSFLSVYSPTGNQEYQTHLTGPGMEEVTAVVSTSDGRVLLGGTFNQSIADAEETQALNVTGGLDGYVAEYTLTASAPLHPQITVRNTAPFITSFSLTGDPADPARVILNAEFDDLGTEAEFGIELGWGDGTGTGFWLEPGQKSVELAHVYVTGPDSPADGIYDVIFGVIDDDFDFAVVSQSIAVDSSPEVTFDTYSLTFSEDAGTVQIPVTLSVPSSADITIPVVWGGTAIEGVDPEFDDYTLVTTDVFIASGQTTGTLTLEILDDDIDELEQKTIELTLLETDGVTLGRTPIMSVGIDDNDVSILDVSADATGSVWEDHGTITALLELSGPRDRDTLITIFASGTADLYTDYSISSPDLETDINGSAVIRIPAGQGSSELQISLVDDTRNETFLESLYFRFATSDPDVLIGTDRVNLVIRDNDPLVFVGDQSLDPDYRNVTEGQSVTVAIALSAPTNTDRVVPLTAYGYGASPAQRNDFAVPSSVTIPAGATKVNLTVPIQEDNLDEKFERFYIARANQIGGSARGKGVRIGINDNDTSVVNVRAQINVGEGASFDVTASLTKPSVSDVKVTIRLSGDATPDEFVRLTNAFSIVPIIKPGDYTLPSRIIGGNRNEVVVTIPAGSQSVKFPIGVNKDDISEKNEDIVMSIVRVTGGAERGTGDTTTILSNRARGTSVKDVSAANVIVRGGSLVVVATQSATTIPPEAYSHLSASGQDSNGTIDLKLPLKSTAGLLQNSTLFFDANFNGRRDFLDVNGDGVFSPGDLTEPAFETVLDGSTFSDIPPGFDRDGNGFFDSTEGQWAAFGGLDTSVDQPFQQTLSAPIGFRVISPISTVVAERVRLTNADVISAAETTLSALGLEGFAIASSDYLFEAAAGDFLAGEAYQADVRLVTTARLVAALFENGVGLEVGRISREVYGNLAEKLNGDTLDFTDRLLFESVIQGVAFRLGQAVSDEVTTAAAEIISSLQTRISAVVNDASRGYVDALATLHKTAEVDLVPVIRGLRDQSDPAQSASDTGAALDSLVAATDVSNVLPPEMYVSDIAVTEGDGGTTIAEIQVGLFGGTDVPVSVAYGTQEESATLDDNDFVPTAGTLTWQPGDAEIQIIQVEINGDNQFEEDEFFDVRFYAADGLIMRHDFGRIYILNDDGFSFAAEETDQPTNVRVVADGDQLEVYQDDVLAFAGGIADSGPINISAFGDVETAFELEVLNAGPLLSNGIHFVGGSSTNDSLVVSSTIVEGSQISLTDATSGQVAFETGTITFNGIETALDSLSAIIDVMGTLTEGGTVTLSAANPTFPVEAQDSVEWLITSDNGFALEGSGQDFEIELGDDGNYDVSLMLQRAGRGVVTASAAFAVGNVAPTAADDHLFVSEDAGSELLLVLTNDTDPADPLQIVSVDGAGIVGDLSLVAGEIFYSPAGSFEHLADGDAATETFTYTINDGDGGTNTATVTLTINGENDAPVVSGPVTANATEDDEAFSVDLLANASDVDQIDELNAYGLTLTSGDDSGVTIEANQLTFDPAAYDRLAVGESEVIVYSYNVVDGNGGSVTQMATLTVSGVNDAPTVSNAVSTVASEDDGVFSVDLLAGSSDVDLGDELSMGDLTLTSGDGSGVTIGANELNVDPSAYNHLAVGESEVIVYSYNVVDGNGGSVTQMATLTVSGVNDAPTVSNAVSTVASEDDGVFRLDLLAGSSDVDLGDELSVDDLTLTSGDDSGVTLGAKELTINPAAYDRLAAGESEVIVYNYNVADGKGGSVSQSATITFSGVNDGPTIESLASSHDVVANSSPDGNVSLSGTVRDIDANDSLTVRIDWGDGSAAQTFAIDRLVDTFDADYRYAGAGVFEVTVTVSDNHGSSVQQTSTAVVQGAGLVGDTLYFIGSDQRDRLWVDETWVYNGSGRWWNPNNWGRRIVASGAIDGDWFYEVVDPATVASLRISTLDGNDRVIVSRDVGLPVEVDAGAGNDLVWIFGGVATVYAGAGDDVIKTGAGNDFVDGGAGNDEILTDEGDDTIVDIHGNNRVRSGSGSDTITTGEGDDMIWSEDGSDVINAGDGNNFVDAGEGDDQVTTGGGDDRVELGAGNDVAMLGAGNDRADGGDDNDVLIGNAGDDDLRGGRGNDLLIGGTGSDRLRGEKDDDLLIAGRTIYDNDGVAVDSIMSEWSRSATYADRLSNLRSGTGNHLDGVALVVGSTVIDDDDADVLRGQKGQDWFFAGLDTDQIRSLSDDEEVDWWNI